MYLLTYLLKLSKNERVKNSEGLTSEKAISNITFTGIFSRTVEMRKNKHYDPHFLNSIDITASDSNKMLLQQCHNYY